MTTELSAIDPLVTISELWTGEMDCESKGALEALESIAKQFPEEAL